MRIKRFKCVKTSSAQQRLESKLSRKTVPHTRTCLFLYLPSLLAGLRCPRGPARRCQPAHPCTLSWGELCRCLRALGPL